jgi:hypothetical protein
MLNRVQRTTQEQQQIQALSTELQAVQSQIKKVFGAGYSKSEQANDR